MVSTCVVSSSLTIISLPFHSPLFSTLFTGPVYRAQGDLFLSPESRLLADCHVLEGDNTTNTPTNTLSSSNNTTTFVYDGQGHRLVFPPAHATEQQAVPLVLVGAGRTLQLRNVRVVHASSLPHCVQLAPGATLDVQSSPDVVLLDGEDPTHQGPLEVLENTPPSGSFWRSTSFAASTPGGGGGVAIRCVMCV